MDYNTMNFKLKKDNVLGGMMMVGENQKKRVLIRKVNSSFYIVEFPYSPRMSEIMEQPYYDIHGETVSSVSVKGETFKSQAEWYNEWFTD